MPHPHPSIPIVSSFADSGSYDLFAAALRRKVRATTAKPAPGPCTTPGHSGGSTTCCTPASARGLSRFLLKRSRRPSSTTPALALRARFRGTWARFRGTSGPIQGASAPMQGAQARPQPKQARRFPMPRADVHRVRKPQTTGALYGQRQRWATRGRSAQVISS